MTEFPEKFPQPDKWMGLNRRGAEQPSEKRVLDFDGMDPRGGWKIFFRARERWVGKISSRKGGTSRKRVEKCECLTQVYFLGDAFYQFYGLFPLL